MADKSRDPQILKAFGDRVRFIRSSLGISQEELADLAGLDRTYISGVERGLRNVSLMNISALAKALKVSVANLTIDI